MILFSFFRYLVTKTSAMQRLHLLGKLDGLSGAPQYRLEVPSFFHQEKIVQTAKEIAVNVMIVNVWGEDFVKAWSLWKTSDPYKNINLSTS